MKHIITAIVTLIIATTTYAQQLHRVDTINVLRNGKTLRWPWVGGHNASTLHSIDLNLDGIKDLLVFDRDGNFITTFLNKGIFDSLSYEHAPQYESAFPKVNSWVSTVDYNCDGKEDLFTYRLGYGCAQVWKNTSTPTQVSFALAYDKLFYKYGPNPNQTTNIYTTNQDISVFEDIDFDGDVDVLTWDNLYSQGSKVWLYKNQRVELGYACDSLTMLVGDSCWGRFTENFNDNSLHIGACRKFGGSAELDSVVNANSLHTGGTLAVMDVDCDNDMEVFIGDVSFSNVVYGFNGGTPARANITSIDTIFPAYNVPIRMSIFPAVSAIDINNDNKKDLFISPNAIGASSENKNSIQYYKNVGAACNSSFALTNKSFINSESIDVGTNAHPTLVDFDSDGKLDLIIGNYYTFSENYVVNKYISKLTSQLDYYKNIGTASAPKFALITTDVDSISKINKKNLHPTFGDIDNDGDLDLILGESTGKFIHYRNNAGAGNVPSYTLVTTALKDAGNAVLTTFSNSTPQLVDVNADGKLDILSGSARGSIFYFENVGSLTSPSFELKSDTLGGIDTNIPNILLFGNSCPQLVTENGIKIMYVSTASGTIHKYNNITVANLYGYYNKLTTTLDSISLGGNTYLTIGAFGNNKRAFIIGTARGGVVLYYDTSSVITNVASHINYNLNVSVSPNPNQGVLTIKSEATIINGIITLFNTQGNVVHSGVMNGYKTNIDMQHQSTGMYMLKIENKENGSFQLLKIVKE
jgi:hypothetical protein